MLVGTTLLLLFCGNLENNNLREFRELTVKKIINLI